jgi:UTP--glucose-1-phosphate uridylyltransferase
MRPLMPPHVRYAYVRQPEQLGLGHAVLCARALVGDEPFAVILPDDLMDADTPVLAQLLAQFEEAGSSVVGVEEVPRHEVDKYGVVAIESAGERLSRLSAIVEKPRPNEAPSTLAVVGRYVLSPRIFDCLACTGPGRNGEIQLTDAIAALIRQEPVYAYRFAGERFDCGSKIGFLAATVNFALKHPEVGDAFARLIARTSSLLAPEPPPRLARVKGAALLQR